MNELQAMQRALELALKGWGRVAPNPLVGAVLLRGGEIVGEGFHAEFGAAHAEVAALDSSDDPGGSTCVVNLEPCAHHGKTPPCTEALAQAGVRRVVFSLRDPHPAAGDGAATLHERGIEVATGLCREQAAALNASFLWNAVRPDRPFVALKLASSLDGYVADKWGRSRWITGDEARQHVHWLRAGFDAIGVGRRTAELDDPELTVRGPVTPRVAPARVIISRSGSLNPTVRLVKTASASRTILLVHAQQRGRTEQVLAETGVTVVPASDLRGGLGSLRELGIRSILIEGGGNLSGALLGEQLVDRIYWYQAPILLGQGISAFPADTAIELRQAIRWVPTERRSLGESNLLVVDRELCLRE